MRLKTPAHPVGAFSCPQGLNLFGGVVSPLRNSGSNAFASFVASCIAKLSPLTLSDRNSVCNGTGRSASCSPSMAAAGAIQMSPPATRLPALIIDPVSWGDAIRVPSPAGFPSRTRLSHSFARSTVACTATGSVGISRDPADDFPGIARVSITLIDVPFKDISIRSSEPRGQTSARKPTSEWMVPGNAPTSLASMTWPSRLLNRRTKWRFQSDVVCIFLFYRITVEPAVIICTPLPRHSAPAPVRSGIVRRLPYPPRHDSTTRSSSSPAGLVMRVYTSRSDRAYLSSIRYRTPLRSLCLAFQTCRQTSHTTIRVAILSAGDH